MTFIQQCFSVNTKLSFLEPKQCCEEPDTELGGAGKQHEGMSGVMIISKTSLEEAVAT